MIALRRINGQELILNADLIETVESTPDTICTLTNGKKILVRNSVEDIVRKVITFRRLCNQTIAVGRRQRSDDSNSSEIGETDTMEQQRR